MTPRKVVGRRPLALTCADGTQDFVPLPALVHDGRQYDLDGAWRETSPRPTAARCRRWRRTPGPRAN